MHPALQKLTPYDLAENDLCEGPFLGGFMPITKGKSLTMSGNACALPVGDINGEDSHRVFYYSIFPNMLLSMHPDYVMVHQIWPQSPDRTLILCDWFFHPEAFDRSDFRPDDAIEFWDMTNKQDWHVCELSQQGIASRAYQTGTLFAEGKYSGGLGPRIPATDELITSQEIRARFLTAIALSLSPTIPSSIR